MAYGLENMIWWRHLSIYVKISRTFNYSFRECLIYIGILEWSEMILITFQMAWKEWRDDRIKVFYIYIDIDMYSQAI